MKLKELWNRFFGSGGVCGVKALPKYLNPPKPPEREKQNRSGWRKKDFICRCVNFRHITSSGGYWETTNTQTATLLRVDDEFNALAKEGLRLFEIPSTEFWENRSHDRRRLLVKWGLTEKEIKCLAVVDGAVVVKKNSYSK